MSFFRRSRKTPAPAVEPVEQARSLAWASGVSSPLGAVPLSVVAAVVAGEVPPAVAACIDDGPDGSGPDWIDVAEAVDELMQAGVVLSGPVYAMGAYGHLDACFTMVDETGERSSRAEDLLDLAVTRGVPDVELAGLYRWAESLAEAGAEEAAEEEERATRDEATLTGRDLRDRAFDLSDRTDPDDLRAGARLYARVAEESSDDADAVLDARLRQHLALYRAGDRDEALPRLAELARQSSVASGTDHLVDRARATLVVDAAQHSGPDAALAAWNLARQQSPRFPLPGLPERMVHELQGCDVPLVMRELVDVLQARDVPGKATREALVIARTAAGLADDRHESS